MTFPASEADPLGEFVAALGRTRAEHMAVDVEPGGAPTYVLGWARLLEQERDRLREQLAEGPAELRLQLSRARRELWAADQALDGLPVPAASRGWLRKPVAEDPRRGAWVERRTSLVENVERLNEHQKLRLEWEKVAAATLERVQQLDEALTTTELNRPAPEGLAVDL